MRNSNIEFLRIICIIMIIVMHVYGQYKTVDDNFVYHTSILCNAICNTGVSIFVLISGYYGLHASLKKWISLYNITTFYALLFLLSCIIRPHHIADSTLFIKGLFPVFCNRYWFVTSYLLLLALSAYIQKLLNLLSYKELLGLIIILSIFTIISPTLLVIEIFNDSGKGFMNMLTVYIIGRYIRLYGFPRLINKYSRIIIPTLTISIWLFNETINNYFGINSLFCRDNNILIIILAVSIFSSFISALPRQSSNINTFAQYVFPIYLAHDIFLENFALTMKSTNILYLVQIPLLVMSLILICIILEAMRRTILGGVFSCIENLETEQIQRLIKKLA